MKELLRIALAAAVLFLLAQFIRPNIASTPPTAQLQAPLEVQHVLQKDCYSCHSNERRLSWFDEIVPAYWLVRSDILTARAHLNFSTLGSKPPAAQRAALYEAVNMIQLGAMPLPQFTALHPDARVTPEELLTLKSYLSPWSQLPNVPPAKNEASNTPHSVHSSLSERSVEPEFNGLPFDPTFNDWKLLSVTDRGDNNTFRFILGNDIAVKAVQSGNIAPWPDGARMAKIAWQQDQHPDGLFYPGKFIQVEMMIKDAHRYKDTDGWGWGRWRGLDLKPYGSNAKFTGECTSCHLPVRGDDYVYTLPITTAHAEQTKAGAEDLVNRNAATLPDSLPYNPLSWGAITMRADRAARTIAVLYGNNVAMSSVRSGGDPAAGPAYAAGSDLALVTWAERDDPHWFGARIPDLPVSIEFVHVAGVGHPDVYRDFSGPGLAEAHVGAGIASQQQDKILTLSGPSFP